MRSLFPLLLLILPLLVLPTARAQSIGTLYTVDTLTNLLSRDPRGITKDGRATVTVLGQESVGDMGSPLILTYTTNDTATAVAGCIWAPTNGVGRFRSRECDDGIYNIRRFGALINSTNDQTAAIRAAGSALQSRGSGTLRVPAGRYLVRSPSGGMVCYFSNLTSFRLEADTATFYTDDFGDSTFLSANLSVAGTTATATTATAHGLTVGQTVVVKNSTVFGYDGPYTIATVPTSTNMTFALSGYSTPTSSGTALIRGQHFYNELFRFKSSTNIQLGKLRFEGVVQPRDIQYRLGWVVTNFREHCRTIRGEITASGASYGIWTGDYDSGTTGDSSDFDVTVTAQDVGYGVSAWGSGHDSRFRIVGQSMHRGMYAGAVRRSRIEAWIRDYDVAGVLVTQQPVNGTTLSGCENLDVTVNDTGTSEDIKLLGVGPTRYMITVGAYQIAASAAHRNLKLRVFARNAPDTSAMQILTYDPLQSVEGLTLSGFIDQRGLAVGDVRHDFYVDQTAATSGVFRDIAIRDLTVLSPADVGGYNATLKLTNLVNDVVVDNYQSRQARNFAFPPGRSVASVPAFPDWRYDSFESGQIQQLGGGVRLSGSTMVVPMNSAVGAGDLTLQWVGSIPSSGNSPLFAVGTDPASAAASGVGASITNGHLLVRLYGASLTDWRGLWVTNWQADHAGRNVALSLVRTPSGMTLWTDGRRNLAGESTAGTAPAWTNSITGTNWVLGAEAAGQYSGTIYRAGAWNSDRSAEFPSLAVGWTGGQTQVGASTNLIDSTTGNGSFETAGGGGVDVVGSWTESTTGASTLSRSTNAVDGTYSIAFAVDSTNSICGITSAATMEYGATYQVSFWARVLSGAGGAVNVVGPADGEAVIQLDSTWRRYSIAKVWAATSITLKRSDLSSRTAEIDLVTVRKMGALADLDWTRSPADLVTGIFPAPSGGSASRIVSRGPGMSGDRGDTNVTLRAGHDAPVQVFASTLSTPRTITLATDHATRGDAFRIVRTATGSTLTVASPVSRSIPADEWLDLVYDGAAWNAVAHGYVAGAYGSGGGGGTNAWKINVNTTSVSSPDLTDNSETAWSVVGSAVSASVKANSLGTNKLTAAAFAALIDRGNHTGTMGWSYVTGTPTTRAGYGITDAQGTLVNSAGLAGALSDETGTGAAVFAASPALTGSPTAPTAADGTSNTVVATTAFVLRNAGSGGGGGGSGNAYTNATQAWAANATNYVWGDFRFYGATTISNLTVPGTLTVDTLVPVNPIGLASGGTGGTNASSARTALGLIIGTDVQAYHARLADIAGLSYSTGDTLYHTGSGIGRLAIGTNNQVLTVSGGVPVWANPTGGSGGTYYLGSLTGDVASGTSPTLNHALIGNGTKWTNSPLASNPLLVTWIGNFGIASRTNADVSTNVIMATYSITPGNAPSVAGKWLEGGFSMLMTNTNSLSANADIRWLANGTSVLEASKSIGGPGAGIDSMTVRLVRESDTTASLYVHGVGYNMAAVPPNGVGTFASTTARQTELAATNIAWNWANTNTLQLEVGLRNTGGGAASGVGAQRLTAGLYSLTESAAVQPASSVLTNVASGFGQLLSVLPAAPSSATNIVLDFGFPVVTYSVTNNVNLVQSTNRPTASTNAVFTLLRLSGDTVDRTLAWHSSWKRLGTNIATIPSNKVVVVSAMVVGSAESGVTFGVAKEE